MALLNNDTYHDRLDLIRTKRMDLFRPVFPSRDSRLGVLSTDRDEPSTDHAREIDPR